MDDLKSFFFYENYFFYSQKMTKLKSMLFSEAAVHVLIYSHRYKSIHGNYILLANGSFSSDLQVCGVCQLSM